MKQVVRENRFRAFLLAGLLSACGGGNEPPVSFLRGQAIPLESWVLKVRQPEMISPTLLAGFRDFRISNAKAKVLAVHLSLEASEAMQGDRQALEKGIVKLMWDCRLKDKGGKEYRLGLPLPNSQFRWMKSGGVMTDQEMKDAILNPSLETSMLPTAWVLLYAVPQDTSGFSLLIRNRSPRKGQPSMASVDLGR